MDSFYSEKELKKLGLKKIGEDVKISRKVSIYSPEEITIGNHVRIDDFAILSGKIEIGNYVHISAYVALYGKYGIKIGNYCGCSARSTIFSATDDFSGNYMISPMVPEEYTNIISGEVVFEDFVQIGANTIVMPNTTIHKGSATGAFTYVNKNLDEWGIYVGIPANRLKDRNKNLLELSKNINDISK